MALYPTRTIIHGVMVDGYKACPYDQTTDIVFPVYENWVNPSGLIQPWGPMDASGHVAPSGIATYLGPSGMTRTYNMPWSNKGYFGHDQVTHYPEVNYYRAFWGCNHCNQLFDYPTVVGTKVPTTASKGDNNGTQFITDTGTQRSQ